MPYLPPDELPPGIPTAAPAKAIAAVESTLTDCSAYLNSLIGRIRAGIESCLMACNANSDHCHSCIAGRIGITLDTAAATHSKCAGKVVNAIRDNLGEAYWYSERFVGPVPTDEEIQNWINGVLPPAPAVLPDVSASGVVAGGNGGVNLDVQQISPPLPFPFSPPGVVPPYPSPSQLPPEMIPPPSPIMPAPGFPQCPAPIINIPPCPAPVITMPPAPGVPPEICPAPLPCPPCAPLPIPPVPAEIPPGFKRCWDGTIIPDYQECPPEPEPFPPPITIEIPPPEPIPPVILPPGVPPEAQDPHVPCVEVSHSECVDNPSNAWRNFWPNWNQKHCPDFTEWETATAHFNNATLAELIQDTRERFGLADSQGDATIPMWMRNASSGVDSAVNDTLERMPLPTIVRQSMRAAFTVLRNINVTIAYHIEDAIVAVLPNVVFGNIPRREDCEVAPAIFPWVLRFVVGIVERWLGEGVSDMKTVLGYQINYWCPNEMIAPGDVHELYSKDFISAETWRCWIRANNLMDNQQQIVADSKQYIFSPSEVAKAWARGLIQDNEIPQRLARNRLKDQREAQIAFQLEYVLPQMNEIVRWAKNLVVDDDTAQRYSLDDGFQWTQGEPYASWIKAGLLSPTHVKDEYRNQWRAPGIAELAQMMFRLRNDSLDQDYAALELTQQDIDYVNQYNSIPQYWRDRLLAIQRPNVGIRYLHLLIRYANWGIDKVVDSLLNEGWTDDKAHDIGNALVNAENDRIFKEISVLSPHDIGRSYASGFMGRDEASTAITSLGYSALEANITLSQADTLRTLKQREEIVKVIEQQYKAGSVEKPEAIALMVDAGIPVDSATLLADQWEARKQSAGKPPREVGAAELCNWFGQGIIDGEEYFRRLIAIGWDTDDALKIVASCGIRISAKQAKGSRPKPGAKPKPERKLTVAELCKLYDQGLIDDQFYYAEMLALNFSPDDAQKLIDSCKLSAAGKRKPAASQNGNVPPKG